MEYYEIAAGTDYNYPVTRNNIHPFVNVGLNKTWTFTDLTLVSQATYYITVRAYSVSAAMSEVVSGGVQAGHSGNVIDVGKITVNE